MKEWSWQKWLGKLIPLLTGVFGAVWSFIESEPQWYPMVIGFGTMIIQWALASFPEKE